MNIFASDPQEIASWFQTEQDEVKTRAAVKIMIKMLAKSPAPEMIWALGRSKNVLAVPFLSQLCQKYLEGEVSEEIGFRALEALGTIGVIHQSLLEDLAKNQDQVGWFAKHMQETLLQTDC